MNNSCVLSQKMDRSSLAIRLLTHFCSVTRVKGGIVNEGAAIAFDDGDLATDSEMVVDVFLYQGFEAPYDGEDLEHELGGVETALDYGTRTG